MWRSLFIHFPRISSAAPLRASRHTSTPPADMDLRTVVTALERVAPTMAAEPWDNVGLLVEPSRPGNIKRVIITNDLTEPVLEEALSSPGEKVGLVVSYHPPLFKPFKRLTQRCAKERIVVRAVEEGVAVYSPHTSLDNMEGGINDWLLAAVGEGQVTALGVRKDAMPYPNLVGIRGNWQRMVERELSTGKVTGVGGTRETTRYDDVRLLTPMCTYFVVCVVVVRWSVMIRAWHVS